MIVWRGRGEGDYGNDRYVHILYIYWLYAHEGKSSNDKKYTHSLHMPPRRQWFGEFCLLETRAETQVPLKPPQGVEPCGNELLLECNNVTIQGELCRLPLCCPLVVSQVMSQQDGRPTELRLNFTTCDLGADAFLVTAAYPVSMTFVHLMIQIFNSHYSLTTTYLELMASLTAMIVFQNIVLTTR